MKLVELRELARNDQTRFTAKVMKQVLDLLDKARRGDLIEAHKERERILSALLKANGEIRSLNIQLGRDRRRKGMATERK